MTDVEFTREIEDILVKTRVQEDRLNARLNLQLAGCGCEEEETFAAFAFDVKEWCLNPYGGVHGGAICSLFDTSMGVGAVALSQKMVSTTDITVSYLKPMNGSRYIFRCTYTQVGRRMIRCMGEARDAESGLLCATAMASFVVTENKLRGLQV